MFAKAIGVDPTKIVYVPFQGGGEALTSMLGGHTEVGAIDISEATGQLEAGKIRGLARPVRQALDQVQGHPDHLRAGREGQLPDLARLLHGAGRVGRRGASGGRTRSRRWSRRRNGRPSARSSAGSRSPGSATTSSSSSTTMPQQSARPAQGARLREVGRQPAVPDASSGTARAALQRRASDRRDPTCTEDFLWTLSKHGSVTRTRVEGLVIMLVAAGLSVGSPQRPGILPDSRTCPGRRRFPICSASSSPSAACGC